MQAIIKKRLKEDDVMQKQRVVITGLGVVSPLGANLDSTWSKLIKGQSGIRRIDRFDVTNFCSTNCRAGSLC